MKDNDEKEIEKVNEGNKFDKIIKENLNT